ncbi:MAG: type II toxin-antitoxin system Phd/YefM family antitoxin [Veillonella atypica]
MPRIIPMKDLRNTNEIMDMCKESNDPIFVTKNGYGELVIMSMEAYESLTRSNEIDKAITQYESDIANHVHGKDARTLFFRIKGGVSWTPIKSQFSPLQNRTSIIYLCTF